MVVTIARYPFTCCQWASMSPGARDALIELVNAAGDRMANSSSADLGAKQRGAIERIRSRAGVRPSKR